MSKRMLRTDRTSLPAARRIAQCRRVPLLQMARGHQAIEPLEDRMLLAATGPYIIAATPTDLLNIKTQPLTALTVEFNEAINFKADGTGSFTVDDIKIAGPAGPIIPTAITSTGTNIYRIAIPAQDSQGVYRVTVGPQITNLAGKAMDQDKDGTPGETTDDAYTWSFGAYNADFTFTTPFTITANDQDYENLNIVVYNTTLIIDGPHSFNSIVLMKGAVLTHTAGSEAGVNLTIAGDAIVDGTSVIAVDGKGYGKGNGPGAGGGGHDGGGAGHGGLGGAGGSAGGASYGAVAVPAALGSGGGSGWDNVAGAGNGGAGGGKVTLKIQGVLTVDGCIRADGWDGTGNRYSGWAGVFYVSGGGGSGGSVLLTVGTLAGSGVISANGGNGGYLPRGGGGAGGRIALYYDENMFTGTLSARGADGGVDGGAGTIFRRSSSQTYGDLRVENAGQTGAATLLPAETYTLDSLNVGGNATLQLPTGNYTLASLDVSGNATLALPTGNHAIDDIRVRSGTTLNIPTGVGVQFHRATVYSGGVLSMEWEGATLDHADDVLEIQKGGLAGLTNWTNSGTILVDGHLNLYGTFNNSGAIALTGSLVIRPPQGTGLSMYATASSQIRSKRIITSAANPERFKGLAAILNGFPNNPSLTSFAGQTVQKGDILVKYTWNGDVNFDGVVDAADYFRIDTGFITQTGGYYNGDLNYDGVVDAADYFLIDSAFIGQTSGAISPLSVASADEAAVQFPAKKVKPDSILSRVFSTEPLL